MSEFQFLRAAMMPHVGGPGDGMNIFEEKLQKLMGKEGWWTVPFDQVWALANAEAEKGRLEKRWNGDTGHIEFRTTTVGDELEKLREGFGAYSPGEEA